MRALFILALPACALGFYTIPTIAPTQRSSSLKPCFMTVAKAPKDTTVAVVGATGYIGKFVVQECVRQGYKTVAVVRNAEAKFDGASTLVADVTDPADLDRAFTGVTVDAMVSCLASRSGTESDSNLIDYQATANSLKAGRAHGLKHFVMLSAFCVKKPLLKFQLAKLKFESELIEASKGTNPIEYSIVRPTAFFKSVSGQLEVVKGGFPFVVFGDGTMCKCNPIAEVDLATYLVDSIKDPKRNNKILDLGGPDAGYTMAQQGELLAEACGVKPNIMKAPVGLFDAIIGGLDFVGNMLPSFKDAAELARIGKYYAVEDMLTTEPDQKFGTITLKQHYERIAREGQDYDPYTTMFAKAK